MELSDNDWSSIYEVWGNVRISQASCTHALLVTVGCEMLAWDCHTLNTPGHTHANGDTCDAPPCGRRSAAAMRVNLAK